jgi:hypothetical protein
VGKRHRKVKVKVTPRWVSLHNGVFRDPIAKQAEIKKEEKRKGRRFEVCGDWIESGDGWIRFYNPSTTCMLRFCSLINNFHWIQIPHTLSLYTRRDTCYIFFQFSCKEPRQLHRYYINIYIFALATVNHRDRICFDITSTTC